MRPFWFLFGIISLGIGAVGIFLPLLPTVPLLLLAAFCFAKSSKKTHDWLISHKTFGPPIQDWNENGAIRRPAKILASISILLAFIISIILKVPTWAIFAQLFVLTCVSMFIWTRPDH